MASHTTWRVDHIGSLLRPQQLKDAFEKHTAGAIGDDDLRAAEDQAIRRVVADQERVGLPVVNDGEFRRTVFMQSFADVAGWNLWSRSYVPSGSDKPNEKTHTDPTMGRLHPVTERLRLVASRPLQEYQFVAGLTSRPAKVTLIETDRICSLADLSRVPDIYPDMEAFAADVVRIEREIVSGLAAAGCQYIQIDAPSFTRFTDPLWQDYMKSRGEEPMTAFRQSIDHANQVIAGHSDVTFGIHLCRGNPADGGYHRQGRYDDIADLLFGRLNHDRFLLEYDTERAGTFEPLRLVPKGKAVVLGLVSSKTATVETVDELRRRIDDAARFLPLEQLAISPQCGFASGISTARQPEDVQWHKFEALVETARQVWGSI